MADRTSARVFGAIFGLLAQSPTDAHKKLAMQIYQLTDTYDFEHCQMGANDACLVLGVARRGVNPSWPEEGEVVLWPGYHGYDSVG